MRPEARQSPCQGWLQGVKAHFRGLIHPSVEANIVERTHHEIFIVSRMAISLIAIAISPLFLAYGGVPALWQAIAFSWMLLPMLAVAVLSRTGRMGLAQLICAVSLFGLSVTFAAGGGMAVALAWLVLVPVEAALSMNMGAVAITSWVTCLAAIVLMAAKGFGLLPMDVHVHPMIDAALLVPGIIYAGSLSYLLVTMHNLARRIEIVRAARLAGLSQVIGDLVLRLDRFGAVMAAGAEAQALFRLKPGDLLGRGFFERVHVADRPCYLKAISDAAAWGATVSATLRLRIGADAGSERADQPTFAWVELRARRYEAQMRLPDDAQTSEVVAVVRDVTTLKRHEAEIEAARAAAERMSQWKDRFLANVSHELRTPLNAIIGFAEMLGNPDLSPRDPAKQREYADIIHSSGLHLLSVVNTILDMSKIEAGSFELLPEPFDMTQLIDLCCDMMRLKANEGEIDIQRDYPRQPMEEIVGDKRACKQILINLLSNAIKFTPARGKVAISVRPDGNSVSICVADTGIGILPRDLPRLGDAFFQATSSYDRPYEGTGLGLSVVRGLVGLHGGNIRIESAHGHGTKVIVRLPLDCRYAARSNGRVADIEAVAAPHPPMPPLAMVKKRA